MYGRGRGGWLVGGGSHYLAVYTLLTLCVCVFARVRVHLYRVNSIRRHVRQFELRACVFACQTLGKCAALAKAGV